MEKIVLSGPADRAAQARQVLAQQGYRVEDSLEEINGHVPGGVAKIARRDYSHGFAVAEGEGWVTCFGDLNRSDDPEAWGGWAAVLPLGFVLRMHSTVGAEGEWSNPKAAGRDPFAELDELKAQLRGAGIALPGGG